VRLVILCSQYSRGNGGSSSLIDLGRAAEHAGAVVDTIVTQQTGLRYGRALFESMAQSRALRLHRAPQALRLYDDTNRRFSAGNLRHDALKTVESFQTRLYSLLPIRRIASADMILVSGMPMPADVSYLRSINPSANLVFNHPGSPTAFLEYWLKNVEALPSEDLNRKRLSAYEKLLVPFDHVLFQSPLQANELRRVLPALAKKPRVIRPGVDEVSLRPILMRRQRFFKEVTYRLVMVGSIQRRKNQMDAIKATISLAEEFPNITLEIIGGVVDSEYFEELKKEVEKRNALKHIIFSGHRKDYASKIAESDILIHTALAEGVPRVLREAMYLEVPIVAYGISGINDLLEDEVSAKLSECGNCAQLRDAVAYLFNSPRHAKLLAAGAKARFSEFHSSIKLSEQVTSQLLSS